MLKFRQNNILQDVGDAHFHVGDHLPTSTFEQIPLSGEWLMHQERSEGSCCGLENHLARLMSKAINSVEGRRVDSIADPSTAK